MWKKRQGRKRKNMKKDEEEMRVENKGRERKKDMKDNGDENKGRNRKHCMSNQIQNERCNSHQPQLSVPLFSARAKTTRTK